MSNALFANDSGSDLGLVTADQARTAWAGTPYDKELSKYITQQPVYDDNGSEISSTWVWNDRGAYDAFQGYLQSQSEFKAQQDATTAAGGNASMLVNYNDFKDDPAKVTAELTRKQWEDYKARFMPTENRLMQMTSYMNPGIVNEQIQQAVGTGGYVTRALDSSAAQAQRGFARYGLTPNAAQQRAISRDTGLTRSKAVVDAANRIRQNITDRNQQIATGSIPNAGRSYGLKTEA